MKKYFCKRYPGISESQMLIEAKSIDTASNAEEVLKMLEDRAYVRIGLLTVGYHLDNAVELFRNYGILIEDQYVAEEIVREIHPLLAVYVAGWTKTVRVKQEYHKELIRRLLLLIDRKGHLLRLVTSRTCK